MNDLMNNKLAQSIQRSKKQRVNQIKNICSTILYTCSRNFIYRQELSYKNNQKKIQTHSY